MYTYEIKLPNNKVITVNQNTTFYDILKTYSDLSSNYFGVKFNNELVPINSKVYQSGTITFVDTNDLLGYKMYQSGLKFILEVALKKMDKNAEVIFNHSIEKGIHCNIITSNPFTIEDTHKLKTLMQEIIAQDLPFKRILADKKNTYDYFKSKKAFEKAYNINNITGSIVALYKLADKINYFYTELPPSTKYLQRFDLVYINTNELALLFPTPRTHNELPEYRHYEKVINNYRETKKWLKALDISYVSDINKIVAAGKVQPFIRICEIKYANDLKKTAQEIINNKAKFVMIAGPSSSGKTTTSKRLAFELRALGLNSITLSVDDYFKDRLETPKDENGQYDYESLSAIDIKLLNEDLLKLLNNEAILPPKYNFVTGKKEFDNHELRLTENGIIILEGLHCLNDDLLPAIDSKLKYKIYLSPFYSVNIDKHNYVSSVDLRLIRRIVRDQRTRGYDISETINNWQSVRRGEEKYIFPYINQANTIINTSLAYEIGALKVFAEPLLYSVTVESPYYEEARRLISFLHNFFPISADDINGESIIREFIGKSDFVK